MLTCIPYTDMFKMHADYYVNPVNCMGISGKGLAKLFKEKYPKQQRRYVAECCAPGHVRPSPGSILFSIGDPVIFFFTKDHWRQNSQIEWIINGCEQLSQILSLLSSTNTIIMPAVGCGCGGLPWPDVKAAIYNSGLKNLAWQNILLIEPEGTLK